jgi:molybdopterin-guanine dinucleotide biosynthesis protein A
VTVPYPDITGALLAGGRSSRMGGAPKGLLRLDGRPLLDRTLELFAGIFGESLLVVGDPQAYAGTSVRRVADEQSGLGPAAGLQAALKGAPTPWVFTAGCDMPFLSVAGIGLLAGRRAGAVAVVPRWDGHLQPLHALWAREALPAVERAMAGGERSLRRLAEAVGARVVEAEAWGAVDPEGRAFLDADTPEEAARLGLLT